jgi:hypothetical protein
MILHYTHGEERNGDGERNLQFSYSKLMVMVCESNGYVTSGSRSRQGVWIRFSQNLLIYMRLE